MNYAILRRGRRLVLTATVGLLVTAMIWSVGGRTASASGSATIGQRAGFAPTSWMLLWGSNTDVARDLDAAAATGAKLLRFDFDWQSAEPSKGSYNWSYIDRVVNGAKARGLSVLGTIAYTPAWARPSGTTDKVPPTNLGDYVNFVRAVVNRYAPQGLHQWEIWNEPNIVQFWQPKPDPANYTSMLKQSYAAIKAIDPSATVVSAGLAPAGDSSDGQYVSPRTFITKMYANGVKGSFDALGMHPYAYPYGIDAVGDWNQWYTLPKTYQIMVDNGDGAKKIWGTEYGAPTGTASNAVSEQTQASFVTQAFNEWTQWTFTGPLYWYALRDSGTNLGDPEQNFGLLRTGFTQKPAYAEFTRQMGLADPNGTTATSSGAVSSTATSTTVAPTTTTTAPTAAPSTSSLSAPSLSSTKPTSNSVSLRWSAPSGASQLTIERSSDGINFAAIATFAASVTSMTDLSLSRLMTYQYRVRASSSAATSPYSNVVSIKTKPR